MLRAFAGVAEVVGVHVVVGAVVDAVDAEGAGAGMTVAAEVCTSMIRLVASIHFFIDGDDGDRKAKRAKKEDDE